MLSAYENELVRQIDRSVLGEGEKSRSNLVAPGRGGLPSDVDVHFDEHPPPRRHSR